MLLRTEKQTREKSTFIKQYFNERTDLPQPIGGRIQHHKNELQLMCAAVQDAIEQRHHARTPSGNVLHFRRNLRQANAATEISAEELRTQLYERYTLRLTERQFALLKQHFAGSNGKMLLDKFCSHIFDMHAREIETPIAGHAHQTTSGGGRRRFDAMEVSRSLV
jgi:hypothetical protein